MEHLNSRFIIAALGIAAIIVLVSRINSGTPDNEGAVLSSFQQGWDAGDLSGGDGDEDGTGIAPNPAYSHNQLGISTTLAGELGMSVAADDQPEDGIVLVWAVNGSDVHEGRSLAPDWFRAGDKVELRIVGPDTAGNSVVLARHQTEILNSPPRVRGISLNRPRNRGNIARVFVESGDSDGDIVHHRFQWYLDDELIESATGETYPMDDLERGQSLRVSVVATDGRAETAPVYSGNLIYDNNSPTLMVSGSARATPHEDGSYTVVCPVQVSDVDGDAVQVELDGETAGVRWDSGSQSLIWENAAKGLTRKVTVRVTDSAGGVVERDVNLRV